MKIKIHITKEVLKESMHCPLLRTCGEIDVEIIKSNCAVSVAIRDIFPNANVFQSDMLVNGIPIPFVGRVHAYISKFDNVEHYEDRLNLPEFSFEIEIPDSIVNEIGIEEIHRILLNSKTLELV